VNPDNEPEVALHGGACIRGQIETQIRDCIASGRLEAGQQLPTVRTMAVELAVNPAAVEEAYHELEREGFLTSAEGSGTFVAPVPPVAQDQAACRAEFERLCSEFLVQAARYDYTAADVITMLETLREREYAT